MKKYLYITSGIDMDDLDNAISLYSENVNYKEFNKFAFNFIDCLMTQSDRIGGAEELAKKVERLAIKYK